MTPIARCSQCPDQATVGLVLMFKRGAWGDRAPDANFKAYTPIWTACTPHESVVRAELEKLRERSAGAAMPPTEWRIEQFLFDDAGAPSEVRKVVRTIAEILKTVEEISADCFTKARQAQGHEHVLLLDVVRRAEEARARTLDLSVAMTAYVTHCLERETEERGPLP